MTIWEDGGKWEYISTGERSGNQVPLVVRERAVARSRFATGAVTLTT